MHARTVSRIVAIILLGVIIAVGYSWTVHLRFEAGRDAFVRSQQQRFDRFYAHPVPIVPLVVSAFLLSSIIVGVYEALAFGVYKVICLAHPSRDEPETT